MERTVHFYSIRICISCYKADREKAFEMHSVFYMTIQVHGESCYHGLSMVTAWAEKLSCIFIALLDFVREMWEKERDETKAECQYLLCIGRWDWSYENAQCFLYRSQVHRELMIQGLSVEPSRLLKTMCISMLGTFFVVEWIERVCEVGIFRLLFSV